MRDLSPEDLQSLIEMVQNFAVYYEKRCHRERSDYVSFAHTWIAEHFSADKMATYNPPRAYLFFMAKNACQEFNRKENRRRDIWDRYRLGAGEVTGENRHDIILLNRLVKVISKLRLKPINADIFFGRGVWEYEHAELAARHGIRSIDARNRYQDTRKKILKAYNHEKKRRAARAKTLQRSLALGR